MGSTVGEATMPAPEQQASMTEADAYVSEQTKQLALAMLDTLASPDATQQQDTQLRFGLSDQGEGQAASGPHVTIAYEAPKEDSVDPDSIHLAFAVPQSVADTLARDGVTPSTIRGALEGSGTRFAYGDVRLNTEGGRVIYANYFVGAQGNGPDGSEIPDIDTGSAATFVNTIYYGAGEHFGYEAVA
ncbi:hypothetical protein CSA80_00365 [Candidatus Saccharibacteria bacterium]|nr:MAG: hypothetical protein CR973_00640 [Candidatus Saccharibacteria bacterium]PID99211.1 MAG: hypothetical protein CSA80_00365 [Candidatus Saccharibacteria bacterium]